MAVTEPSWLRASPGIALYAGCIDLVLFLLLVWLRLRACWHVSVLL